MASTFNSILLSCYEIDMSLGTETKHLPLYHAFSVLVIHGESDELGGLLRTLDTWFTTVDCAETCLEARKQAHRNHYDLVLVDVGLFTSEPSLLEELSHWHQNRSDVLLLVHQNELDLAIAAFRHGLFDFVLNPVHPEQMAHTVRRFMDKRLKERRLCALQRDFSRHSSTQMIGQSEKTKLLRQHIEQYAPSKASVMIEGQPGTGKELIARELHEHSHRIGPFVPFSCTKSSPETIEKDLFGEVITLENGSRKFNEGVFKVANGGTIYLDEVAHLPMRIQELLLSMLEERTIKPVGAKYEFPIDVRVIAATNHNLNVLVQQGKFRSDLLYRLSVLKIEVAPLKERKTDLKELVPFLANRLCHDLCLPLPRWTDEDIAIIRDYEWPGNVRELRNLIENCILLGKSPSEYWRNRNHINSGTPITVTVSHGNQIPYYDEKPAQVKQEGYPNSWTLRKVERCHIEQVVLFHDGNKSAAARALAVSRKTLERKYKEWDSSDDDSRYTE